MLKLLTIFPAVALSVGLLPTAMAYDCDHSRDIDRELDADSLTELRVDAGAGSLDIIGKESLDRVLISARLCAEDKDELEEMDVKVRSRLDTAIIETDIPDSSGWYGGGYKSIDLTLTVPARLELDVDDSSGQAKISNVASLKVDDSSGSLEIEQIKGDVEVEDSSGSIEIEDIGGNVQINDSSGAIWVRNVGKNLHVESDSSGGIEGRQIAGDFIVDRDSSGSISAKEVQGDFVVRRDGSGGIHYGEIGGNVDIPERKRKD